MSKVLGGIFSFIPLVTYVVFLSLFLDFYAVRDPEAVLNDAEMAYMWFLFAGICVSVISTFAVMVWFIYRVHKNINFIERQKIVWYMLLYFGNMFVYPVFWFLYIFKRVDEKYPFSPYRNKLWW